MHVPNLTLLEFDNKKIITLSEKSMFFYDRMISPKYAILESVDNLIKDKDFIDQMSYTSMPWRIETAKNHVHLNHPSDLFWKHLKYVKQSQYNKFTKEFWDKSIKLELYYATIAWPILEKPNHMVVITNNEYYKGILKECQLTEINTQSFLTH